MRRAPAIAVLLLALTLPAAAFGCTVGNVISTCPRQPAKGSVAGAADSSGIRAATQPYGGVLTPQPVHSQPCVINGVLTECPDTPRAGSSLNAADSAFAVTDGGVYSGQPVSVTFPNPAPAAPPPPPPPPPSLSAFTLSASVATAYPNQTYTLSWTAATLSHGSGTITYTPHWSESTGTAGNLAATTGRSASDTVSHAPTTVTYYVTASADGASVQSNSVSIQIIAEPPVYQWEDESQPCPAGQVGHDTWQELWEISPVHQDMGQQRNVSYTCYTPASLGPFTLSASVSSAYVGQSFTLSWTAPVLHYGTGTITYTPHWSETNGTSGTHSARTSRTDTTAVNSGATTVTYYVTATADGATSQSNSVSVTILAPVYQWENESQACPVGQVGHDTWQELWETAPVRRDTGQKRNVSDTCAVPPPVYQWENESQACPPGYSGHDTWQELWEISPVRRDTGQKRYVSYTCTPPPSLGGFTLSASVSTAYLHQTYTLSWTAPVLYNGSGTITYTPHWSETNGTSGTHTARTGRTDTTAVNSGLTTVTYYVTATADGVSRNSNSVSVKIIAQPPPPPPPICGPGGGHGGIGINAVGVTPFVAPKPDWVTPPPGQGLRPLRICCSCRPL